MHDDYKQLDIPQGVTLEPCPVCRSASELWQYSESETAPRRLLVCCTHGEAIGPQDGLTNEGCLLYMPPDNFYRETIRDAVRYWNDFAKALNTMRRQNNWQAAQVLRKHPKEPTEARQTNSVDLTKPHWRCVCGAVAMPLTDDTRCNCTDIYAQAWSRVEPTEAREASAEGAGMPDGDQR